MEQTLDNAGGDLPPLGEPSRWSRLARGVRLFPHHVPLALPLAGVVGALAGLTDGGAGAWGWVLAAGAVLLAACLRLPRIAICTLLATAIAALHALVIKQSGQDLRDAFAGRSALTCEGTIIATLNRGVVLREEATGARVSLRGDLSFQEGDVARVTFSRHPNTPPLVRGMYDRNEMMRQQGIAMEADFIEGEVLRRPFSWAAVRGHATRLRNRLADRIMPHGTEADPNRQVLCSLVLGARDRMEAETMDIFRRGGCLYVFAVSGMHVGLIAGFLWLACRLLRIRPGLARVLQVVLLGLYVVIAGFAVPAMRAYLMLALLIAGFALRRQISLANIWCAAALIILLVEPWQLGSAGFLLSFAIYAVLAFGASFFMRDRGWLAPDPFIPRACYTRWERWRARLDFGVRGAGVVSLLPWLVSLPLAAVLFHTINTFGFAANLAITPLVPLVMAGGLAMLALAGVPLLGELAAFCALRASGALVAVTSLFDGLPYAYLPAAPPQPTETVLVLGTVGKRSVCLLGNHGLLLGGGDDKTAQWTTGPALFHSGCRPAALLSTDKGSGGVDSLRKFWGDLELFHAEKPATEPFRLRSKAGAFTIYPPPADLPRRLAANAAPVVRWRAPSGRSVLYVGDASLATLERLPETERQADALILGHNPRRPVCDAALLKATGARIVTLLPSAEKEELEAVREAGAQALRVSQNRLITLRAAEDGWRASEKDGTTPKSTDRKRTEGAD